MKREHIVLALIIILFSGLTILNSKLPEKIIVESGATQFAGRSSDDQLQSLSTDSATDALNIVDYEHHEIHSGRSFIFATSTDIAASGQIDILIDTNSSSSRWSHMIIELTAERETEFYLYEDCLASASGTAQTQFNRDRNSSNTSNILVYDTPTISSVGTLLEMETLGSGRNIGGETRGNEEIILKADTSYLIRIKNTSASTGWVTSKLDYYQHTNR